MAAAASQAVEAAAAAGGVGVGDGAKPLLLVDVDGVLAPWGWQTIPEGYEEVRCGQEPDLCVNLTANRDRLRKLLTLFEPVWCTARFADVRETIGSLHGIGEDWQVVEFWKAVYRSGSRISVVRMDGVDTWKLPFVNAWLAVRGWERRPLAWLDDDLLGGDVIEWAAARGRYAPTKLVRVPPAAGFTDEHLAELVTWGLRVGS